MVIVRMHVIQHDVFCSLCAVNRKYNIYDSSFLDALCCETYMKASKIIFNFVQF